MNHKKNSQTSKQNLLKVEVNLSRRARWYTDLQEKMSNQGINVKWQKGNFHITIIFMKDDTQREKLKSLFENIILHRPAPQLTFNKLDVFTGKKNVEHIINLTSTCVSGEFNALIDDLRTVAIEAGAKLEDFRLHVTLGRVPVDDATPLGKLSDIISTVNLPTFTLTLSKVQYKYLEGDPIRLIASWEMSM